MRIDSTIRLHHQRRASALGRHPEDRLAGVAETPHGGSRPTARTRTAIPLARRHKPQRQQGVVQFLGIAHHRAMTRSQPRRLPRGRAPPISPPSLAQGAAELHCPAPFALPVARRRERRTGLAFRISCPSGDGSAVSTRPRRDRSLLDTRNDRSQPVDIHGPRADNRGWFRRPEDGPESGSRRSGSPDTPPDPERPRPAGRPSAFAGLAAAPCAPRQKRSTASARDAFQRQRAPNIGAGSMACVSTSSTVSGCRKRKNDLEWEAVLLGERDYDAVVGRGPPAARR